MRLKTLGVASAVACSLFGPASAGQTLSLMLAPQGGSVDIVFLDDMTATDAFMIRLTGIVAPGSRIRISIDKDSQPLTDRIIMAADCDFGSDPALCLVPIQGGTPEFDALVGAFKAGLVAHLEITNPGFVGMKSSTSLIGFTKAFDVL